MLPLPDYTLSSPDLLDAHKEEVETGINSKLLELMNIDSMDFIHQSEHGVSLKGCYN